LRNETNLGISPTLNRGIEVARSELIGRMDADDISVNHRFADQLSYLEAHPDVAVVGTYAYHINNEGIILGLSATGPASIEEFTELRRSGAHTMVFGGSAVFAKALAAKVGGYDEAFVTAEDLEIFDRMAEHGPVVVMTEPLLLYRIYPSSYVMRTFFEGRTVHRYVRDRRRRKMANRPQITLDEFKRRQRARPRRHRIAVRLDDLSRYLYRRAGVEFAMSRNGRAVGFMALAAVTQPGYAIPRIWSQRLSPGARRSRMAATREQERARS
jgi:GT2 family glycosyltransferase